MWLLILGKLAIQNDGQGVRLNPHPRPNLNILWKWNNLVSVRPNYFILMGYLRKMKKKSAKRTHTPLYMYMNPHSRNPGYAPDGCTFCIYNITREFLVERQCMIDVLSLRIIFIAKLIIKYVCVVSQRIRFDVAWQFTPCGSNKKTVKNLQVTLRFEITSFACKDCAITPSCSKYI